MTAPPADLRRFFVAAPWAMVEESSVHRAHEVPSPDPVPPTGNPEPHPGDPKPKAPPA